MHCADFENLVSFVFLFVFGVEYVFAVQMGAQFYP